MSSGERNRNSLNLYNMWDAAFVIWVLWGETGELRDSQGVRKLIVSRSRLESRAIGSESLVGESNQSPVSTPSSAGHEKSCVNLGGPPSKAKYSLPPIADSTVRER